jgi:voltage-gated potassium channel
MNDARGRESLRTRAFRLLTSEDAGVGGEALRAGLVALIVVSVATGILRTVPGVAPQHAAAIDATLFLTTTAFALEYLLRIWVAPGDLVGAGAAKARLHYVFSLPGLVDFLAAIPFTLAPRYGLHIDWLDMVPIFKLLRYSSAFQFLVEAIYSQWRVLASAATLMLALLVFQSSVVYYFERDVQPDKFGSIPAAMWWGIITLTTVGYGDVTPVTLWGRIAGGFTAVLGIFVFAVPIGIIASAFVEAVRRREFVVTWNLVANVPLFSNLDASRIAAIAALLRTRQVERGERLVRKGDDADSMYFIVSGEVEVDVETGAKPHRLGAGEFFGEVALIASRTRTATVTAATGCKLLVLHKRDLHGFMEAHPEFADLIRETARRRIAEIDAPRLAR